MGKKQTNEIEVRKDGFAFGKNRLLIEGDPGFDNWAAFGETLKQVDGALHWWIGDWLNFGEARYGERYAQAIEDTGFAYATLRDDKWVSSRFGVSRRRDILSWSHHKEVAGLDETEQDKLLDAAIKEKYSVRQLRQAKIESTKRLPVSKAHYEVIYADPPSWENVAEICQIPVATMAAADAALFLWVPVPMIDEALQVIKTWGFDYASMFIWDREKVMYSDYNAVRHEVLLVCVRGNYKPGTFYSSVQRIACDKSIHTKPPKFYEIIEKMYAGAKRINLFATKKRKGWDMYLKELS